MVQPADDQVEQAPWVGGGRAAKEAAQLVPLHQRDEFLRLHAELMSALVHFDRTTWKAQPPRMQPQKQKHISGRSFLQHEQVLLRPCMRLTNSTRRRQGAIWFSDGAARTDKMTAMYGTSSCGAAPPSLLSWLPMHCARHKVSCISLQTVCPL